jgi:hypothetical protein
MGQSRLDVRFWDAGFPKSQSPGSAGILACRLRRVLFSRKASTTWEAGRQGCLRSQDIF